MTASTRKPKPQTQADRFIDAARKAGCSENEAEFDENLKKLVDRKPKGKMGSEDDEP